MQGRKASLCKRLKKNNYSSLLFPTLVFLRPGPQALSAPCWSLYRCSQFCPQPILHPAFSYHRLSIPRTSHKSTSRCRPLCFMPHDFCVYRYSPLYLPSSQLSHFKQCFAKAAYSFFLAKLFTKVESVRIRSSLAPADLSDPKDFCFISYKNIACWPRDRL